MIRKDLCVVWTMHVVLRFAELDEALLVRPDQSMSKACTMHLFALPGPHTQLCYNPTTPHPQATLMK